MSQCRWLPCRPARVQEDVCKSVIRSWLNEGHASLGLVVVGEAGQGKSSLINGLLGKEVAKEGDDLDPETQKLEKYSYEENGVAVSLWDSPGFGIDSDEKGRGDTAVVVRVRGASRPYVVLHSHGRYTVA